MNRHGQEPDRHERSVPRGGTDWLLRAIEELRALERAKRHLPHASRPFHDLQRRLDAKAREVFRIAGETDDDGEATSSSH